MKNRRQTYWNRVKIKINKIGSEQVSTFFRGEKYLKVSGERGGLCYFRPKL
jgi:hypothetical protein